MIMMNTKHMELTNNYRLRGVDTAHAGGYQEQEEGKRGGGERGF